MQLETVHEYRGDIKSWRHRAEKSPSKKYSIQACIALSAFLK